MATSTASNVIDQAKLNNIVEFEDITALDVVEVKIFNTGSNSVITPATQRIGEEVTRIKPADVAASVQVIIGAGIPTAGEKITFVTTDGSSQEFECTASTTSGTQFGHGGTASAAATNLKSAIEASSIGSKLLVGAVTPVGSAFGIIVTQVTVGSAGNKEVISNLSNVYVGAGAPGSNGSFTGGADKIRVHEDFGLAGTRIGQTTVFGEYSDTKNIDHLRQGKNVADLKHFAKGTLPFVSVNTGKVLCDDDGRVKHQMTSGHSYGQSSLYQVFDDRKRKLIPFEDFPGKLDPVALVSAGDYIMQYMIVTDLTRDIDKFINPDTMDGVIEVFEIRRQFANTNFSDIQINGIRCDLSTGDWNFDQKGSSLIDTKFEKKQAQSDYFEDAQDTLFSGHVFASSGSFAHKLGYPVSASAYFNAGADKVFQGAEASKDRYFALPGYTSEGYYGIAPFDDTTDYVANSYVFANTLAHNGFNNGVYDLNGTWVATTSFGPRGTYNFSDALVSWWRFNNAASDGILDSSNNNNNTLTADSEGETPALLAGGGSRVVRATYASEFEIDASKHTYFGKDLLDWDGTDDYLSAAASSTLTFGDGSNDSPFSVTGWFYWDASGINWIVAKHEGSGFYDKEFDIFLDGSRYLNFYVYDKSGTAVRGKKTSLTVATSEWVHFAVTYDGSGLNSGFELYLNGTQRTGDSISAGTYTAMEDLNIPLTIGGGGPYLTSASQFFDGKIAEICVWNRVLTSNEANTLYLMNHGIRNDQAQQTLQGFISGSSSNMSDIGTRFTSCNTGFIFGKSVTTGSNASGFKNHLGVDSIAFGGLIR